jgi:hypothetical protein
MLTWGCQGLVIQHETNLAGKFCQKEFFKIVVVIIDIPGVADYCIETLGKTPRALG